MRVLRVALWGHADSLSHKLIHYLLDAGHQVWIITPSWAAEKKKWETYSNLNCTAPDQPLKEIDFGIRLHAKDHFPPDFPTLGCHLFLLPRALRIQISFQNQSETFCLKEVQHSAEQYLGHDIFQKESFSDDLADLVIDALIAFTRFETIEYPGRNIPLPANYADAFLHYERTLKSIDNQSVYDSLPTLSESPTSTETHTITFTVETGFSCHEVACAALLLMSLFQGRRTGTFAYDLWAGCTQLFADRVGVRPCVVSFSHEDTLENLCKSLQAQQDELLSPFLVGDPFAHNRPRLFSLIYGAKRPQSLSALLVFHYCPDAQRFSVSFPKEWVFFTQTETWILSFLRHFKTPEKKVDAVLHNTQLVSFQGIAGKVQSLPTLSIPHYFRLQVQKQPKHVAVTCGKASLTYEGLEQRANALAQKLHKTYEIGPKSRVAICMTRCVDMIVALLGVLKTGAAYVPLDPQTPSERLQVIVQDAEVELVLTQDTLLASMKAFWQKIDVPFLDVGSFDQKMADFALPTALKAQTCAYITYTSGTTGKPKGVMVCHGSILNLLNSLAQEFQWQEEKLLAVTAMTFDIAALEIWGPLLKGGTIVLAQEEDILSAQTLCRIIKDQGITLLQATPSLWQGILDAAEDDILKNVKALCGGEPLSLALKNAFCEQTKACWNVYGPTETTIWSTCVPLSAKRPVSIGKPLANTWLYILDQEKKLVPLGAEGELYIAGAGVALGYWNNPGRTKNAFLAHSLLVGIRNFKGFHRALYKTGDIVRLNDQGNLVFLRRCDTQVKIRGHRIELGDIEAALLQHPDVTVCAVTTHTKPSGENALVAYYLQSSSLTSETLETFLKNKLPTSFLPERYVAFDSFPLNANGKIDRRKLPPPVWHSLQEHESMPKNALERDLRDIWADVLKVTPEKLGMEESFFDLGGSSLSGIHLVNHINRRLNADIQIRDVFEQKTIRNLAPLVEKSRGGFLYQAHQLSPDTKNTYAPFPLSTVQQTYYFGRFSQFELSSIATHIYTVYRYDALDVTRLEQAFHLLLKRHPVLRTTFSQEAQTYLHLFPAYKISVIDDPEESQLASVRARLSHKVYEPGCFPLFDIVLTRHKGYVLLHISFEAILIDMTSFHILFAEWATLYNNLNAPLPALTITYRDYVLAYEKLRQGPLFEKAKAYWTKKLDTYRLDLNLPLKNPPAQIKKPNFKRISCVIASPIWEKIKRKAQAHQLSLTAVVLEAYGRVLSRWSGQVRLSINLTLFNRLPLHEQVDHILGDFTVLGLFAYQRSTGRISEKLLQTHKALLDDIEHNLFDGVDVQRLLKKERNLDPRTIIAPVVLTSVLGNASEEKKGLFDLPLGEGYQGIQEGISQTSQTWLDHKAYETHKGFVAEWDYVDDLFDSDIIEAMHADYCTQLIDLAEKEWVNDSFSPFALQKKDQEIIRKINTLTQSVPQKTLVSLLEPYQHATPPALWDETLQRTISYTELYCTSEKLAHALQEKLTADEPLIGLLSEKGYGQVLGALGIMKTGRAYLPLSMDWPEGRLKEILKTAGVKTLLVSKTLYTQFLALTDQVLCLDALAATRMECRDTLPAVRPQDTAYVIFTSGSTGIPKGVSISHEGALNTLYAVNEQFKISAQDRALAISDLSFDLSVYDIFGMLLAGGCVVFPAQTESKTPSHWKKLIQKHHVTIWNTVPQLAALLIEGAQPEELSTLRLFLLSGDWVPVSLPKRLKMLVPHATKISLGGATEASIWSIWYDMANLSAEMETVPYGLPMPNQRFYVLNETQEICPLEVPGELYIGGAGLAQGYWKAPAMTQASFFQHPTLGRLYRTGDRGSVQKDGTILFLGRQDHQVKRNGFRVELQEIEAKLTALPGIKNAYATIQKEGELLVGYLLPEKQSAAPGSLRDKSEKDAFLLQQTGLMKTGTPRYVLDQAPDEVRWRRLKSYRRFQDNTLDPHTIQKLLDALPNEMQLLERKGRLLCRKTLKDILTLFSGLSLSNRLLPKYLYPSAGSSYGVRLMLHLPENLEEIEAGTYYYHPFQQALCPLSQDDLPLHATSSLTSSFHLVAHWPAVRPLYGDFSERLAFLEAGHMIGLLSPKLSTLGLPHNLHTDVQTLDEENTLLASLTLDEESFGKGQNCAMQLCSTRALDVDVVTQASPMGAILKRSQWIVRFQGESTPPNLIKAGLQAQGLMEKLLAFNIGSCPLGWKSDPKDLYTLALGAVTAEQMTMPESCPENPSLKSVVQEHLQNVLPTYMIPTHYTIIDAPPLSANGKLDRSRLPKALLETKHHSPPQNDRENLLHCLWAEVLNMPPEAFGVEDSFFLLGGNSLTAMTVIQRLQSQHDLHCTLASFYAKPTIRHLACVFIQEKREVERQEGTL